MEGTTDCGILSGFFNINGISKFQINYEYGEKREFTTFDTNGTYIEAEYLKEHNYVVLKYIKSNGDTYYVAPKNRKEISFIRNIVKQNVKFIGYTNDEINEIARNTEQAYIEACLDD